jgi:hypothetical protein
MRTVRRAALAIARDRERVRTSTRTRSCDQMTNERAVARIHTCVHCVAVHHVDWSLKATHVEYCDIKYFQRNTDIKYFQTWNNLSRRTILTMKTIGCQFRRPQPVRHHPLLIGKYVRNKEHGVEIRNEIKVQG